MNTRPVIRDFDIRTQVIRSLTHSGNVVEVEIEYHAILGTDFPNGMKRGQELKLSGRSIFEFRGNRISAITDIS